LIYVSDAIGSSLGKIGKESK